jgi:hypothetical protein
VLIHSSHFQPSLWKWVEENGIFVHSFLIALLFALCASPRRFMFKATCKALEEKIHKKSIFYKVSTRSVRKQKFMRQKESWFHGGGYGLQLRRFQKWCCQNGTQSMD